MRGMLIGLVLSLGLVVSAQAADTVSMTKPPSLAKGVDAMPVIANPTDDAQSRINTAVKRLDDKVRKAMVECRQLAAESVAEAAAQGDKKPGDDYQWGRSVAVTMQGPRFLSYRITDDTFCGGAYPNTSTMAIVYDLTDGRPVDWTKLLPASLTGNVALDRGADGSKIVTLASPKLFELYMKNYRTQSGQKKDSEDDKACREAIAPSEGGSPPAMMVWLDAAQGGLALHYELAHAVQACIDVVTIPIATLRAFGAKPVLLDALTEAHRSEGSGATTRP